MGQMESKMFQVSFPSTMKSETLAGVEGKVTLLVCTALNQPMYASALPAA